MATVVEIVYPTCCGIDVHKNFLVACIAKTDERGHTSHLMKRFSTNTGDLRRLADWLATHNCTDKKRRNVGQKKIFYEPDHHEGIVSIDEHVRSLLLLKANHKSPYFNHLYEIKMIRNGLLSGFIPISMAFGGYDAGHYLGAFVMARVPEMDIETEVAHITGTKRVRRELFSDKNTAVLTVSGHGIQFNNGCIPLMKGTDYVEVLLHPSERLLAVRKTTRRNKNAVPWNVDGILARQLSTVLYELMGWQKHWRYKMTANCFAKDNEHIVIFDLDCCEFRIHSGKKGGKTMKGIPEDWLSEFGDAEPEYMLLCRRAMADKLDNWKTEIPIISETGIRSRGGLQDYSEITSGNVQRVRGEFLSPTFKPKVTLAINSVTFNMSCVNLFPDNQHVSIWIDEPNLRLIIEPTFDYERDNLKFANYKKGRNNPRKCMAKYFCPMLYEFMKWNPAARYHCLAIFQQFGHKKVIVFNLDECQQVFTEIFQDDDGKKRRKPTVNMPIEWKDRFGYTMTEWETKTRVDFNTTLITVDNKTGERHYGYIEAKLPTPEELIHRPYGGLSRRREDTENG